MSGFVYVTKRRGFVDVLVDPEDFDPARETKRLVGESSAIDDYPDALERPGSSFLWVGGGDDHHLDREHVAALRDALTRWLETGSLRPAVAS